MISSGDTENYDHPQPTIVSASAITGQRLVAGESMVAPLIYMTEVARSVDITDDDKVDEYGKMLSKYELKRPTGAKRVNNTIKKKAHFRLFLDSKQ